MIASVIGSASNSVAAIRLLNVASWGASVVWLTVPRYRDLWPSPVRVPAPHVEKRMTAPSAAKRNPVPVNACGRLGPFPSKDERAQELAWDGACGFPDKIDLDAGATTSKIGHCDRPGLIREFTENISYWHDDPPSFYGVRGLELRAT